MPGNISVAVSQANITVDSTNSTVAVGQTISNVIVGESTVTSNADIRSAISNVAPILYNTSTGVISFDTDRLTSSNVVAQGNLGGNITLDIEAGAYHTITPTSNITGITLSNFNSGDTATLVFTQNSTGGVNLDTTTHASNWTAWEFAGGAKVFDLNPNNFSVVNIFGIGTTGASASEYYASIVLQENSDTLTDLTVTGNVTAGNVNSTFHGNGAGITGLTTSIVSEGTNLYYTDARARASINTLTNSASGGGALSYNAGSGTIIYTPPDLTAFGLTNAQAQAFIESNGLTMTSAISSNSNVTTTANTSAVHGTFTGADSITATGNVTSTGVATFGNAATQTHNFTGNLDIAGNITATGNINYQNVTDLFVRDQSITLNANAATDATSSIIINRPVAGANTVLRWNETDDKWQFSNDGTAYQNLIGLTDFSITTASASGSGALSYSNTTGVFTFTPADLSAGVSNAQAQAFIQANGLAMTANLTSNTHISTTGAGTFDSGISMTNSSTFDPLTMQQDSSSSIGMDVTFKKSRGGGQANDNDRIVEWNYEIHDGTDFIKPLEAHVYVDSFSSSSKGTGVMPLAWEIHGKTGGDTTASGTVSMLRVTNDRVIAFNDSGSRGFGTGAGNANITADGTINTVSGINATGNIVAGAFIGPGSGITGLTTTNVAEGTNEYFTTARANTAIGNYQGTLSTAGNITAGNISTGGLLNITGTSGITTGTSANVTVGKALNVGAVGLYFRDTSGSDVVSVIGGGNISVDTNITMATGKTFDLTNGDLDMGQGTLKFSKANVTDTPAIEVENNQNAEMEVLKVTSADDTGTAISNWKRARNDTVSPTAISASDYVHRNNYFGHDGTNYLNTFASGVYQDSDVGSVSTGVVPLAYEITTRPGGNTSLSNASIIRFDSNRNIIFNDTGVQTAGAGTGNASISEDGTINSVGNLSVNSGTAVDELFGLHFNKDTNYLGLGTTTPEAVIHVKKGTGSNFVSFKGEHYDNSTDGIEFDFERAGGTVASPTVIGNNDLVQESRYKPHDGTDFIETMAEYVYHDNLIQTPATNQVALTKEFVSRLDTSNNLNPILTLGGNGLIRFNKTSQRNFGSGTHPFGTANLTQAGAFHTAGNITAGTGAYFIGDGSQLTNTPAGDSFGTFTVSGQTNVQASQANAQVEFAAGSGIAITTSANTITIAGSGGSYGNTEVSNYLSANVQTANIDTQGNVNVNKDIHLANAVFTDNIFPFTPGGAFNMTSLRATDVGIGSPTFFFPDTGGNQTGAVLTTQANGVGTFNIGLSTESESAVDMIDSRVYRNSTNGTALDFYRAGGNIASPTAPGSNDYLVQFDAFCHDGTQFLNAAGYHIFQDGDSGSVGTNDTPVSHEFYVKKDQTGFQKSVMKLTADQKIIFNDTGVRSFGDYKGTANIAADGSFHTAGDVTIDGRLKLPNYTTTEVNALSSPAAGDTVFNTTESTICFYNGSAWHKVTSTAL